MRHCANSTIQTPSSVEPKSKQENVIPAYSSSENQFSRSYLIAFTLSLLFCQLKLILELLLQGVSHLSGTHSQFCWWATNITFGVRVRSQNKLKLKIHYGGLQCLCKDTALKTSEEDKKYFSTFLQDDSVLPSPQEINQSVIKTYFQLLKFTSSLVDFSHINRTSNSKSC